MQKSYVIKKVINFPSYHLTTQEEEIPLSFGFDEHILTGLNRNKVFTKFEKFYQNILNDIPNLPEYDTIALENK